MKESSRLSSPNSAHDNGQPQPLPACARRPKRAASDKGLPPDRELLQLAKSYIEHQSRSWPQLVAAGYIPPATDPAVAEFVADFKRRHRGGEVDMARIAPLKELRLELGGGYGRYSCDNSSPTSIVDQLSSILRRAKADGKFIPWDYIFADYSVSGLIPSRRGYSSYKEILTNQECALGTMYIDDFTRASREEIEWWKLAHLAKRLGKELIGASDGFRLSDPNSEVLITVYALVSRLFIKSLREKVKRGMRGGHGRMAVLGRLPFGFTRIQKSSEAGHLLFDHEGKPVYERCCDPKSIHHVRRLFEMFAVELRSLNSIAKQFNENRVSGWGGWSGSTLKMILDNPAYIGVFIWNRSHYEVDPDTGERTTIRNPMSEWEFVYDATLAPIPHDLFFAARERLMDIRAKCPNTGKPRKSRNENSSSTLVSGTCICGYCGGELKLIRSAGKYKQLGCLNGPSGRCGCRLRTSKSVTHIEESLLAYLKETLISNESIERMVTMANAFLNEEMQRPRTDLNEQRGKLRRLTASIKKLVRLIEEENDKSTCWGYQQRLRELESERISLQAEIAQVESREQPVPEPLDADRIKGYLADMRGLLCQDIPAAAEAIRRLTGKITIRQEAVPSRKRGAKWIATFAPDFVRFLAPFARSRNYPDSMTLEYLSARNWTIQETCSAEIRHETRYERMANDFRQMHARGMSVAAMATETGMGWDQARQCLDFAVTNIRPDYGGRKRKRPGGDGPRPTRQRYKEIAGEVLRLRSDANPLAKESFRRIAIRLGVSVGTALRAYDFAVREQAMRLPASTISLSRGRGRRIAADKIAHARRLLLAGGLTLKEIAHQSGVSQSEVCRMRIRMRSEGELT